MLKVCNFNDLSSIEASQVAEVQFFEPPTSDACMLSIALSDLILSDLIVKVVENDAVKDIEARRRAIRLSICAAWTTAFNN